jgi:hypothetical protein
MRSNINKIVLALACGAATLVALSCNSINKESSPVKLVVTNDQTLQQIDLAPGATGCDQNIATINLQSVLLQDQSNTSLPTDNRFNDVKIDSYSVSYVRTDGGKAIPQPFVRSISGLILAGGSSSFLTQFLAFEPDAVTQAPFVSLLPVNGGRDPETGKDFVKLDVIVTVFGQTLAGERVSGSTRLPLNFCFATCNGCR